MKKTALFLIRHGETAWNVERRLQGYVDIPLNEQGMLQADAIGEFMQDISLDRVYASDLKRAVQTAEKIARPHGLTVKTYADLRERAYGELEELTHEQIAERYPDQEARRQGGVYGIEPFDDLQQRVVTRLTELAKKHSGASICVVSHGGSINAFLHWVTNGQLGTGITSIKNTSMTQMTFLETEEWEVVAVNQAEHLRKI